MIPEYRIDYLRRALGHRYEFQAFLGRGAFATVLLVRNLKLGRQEALKVLQESFDGDHEFAKRFVDEARLVASLDHPNIVKVYDYGDVDGVLWYSMQYIAGPSLGTELEARSPLLQREAISLAVPLLDALAYSHSVGIVHRDVKPGNVMVSPRGRPYLMDFGIAKVKDSGFKTATGSVLGTPAYISPEQASGELVDGRSDVYSLGICLYQLLTGALPFPAPDPIQMLLRRLREDPEPLSKRLPSIDPELESIVLKSLARSKEDRFQSAGEMKDRLIQSFQQEIDSEAIQLTAVVNEPSPLKEPRLDPGASRSEAPAGVLEAGSEAPTIATQVSSSSPKKTSRRFPVVAIAALATSLIAAAMIFFFRPSDSAPAAGADPASQIKPPEAPPATADGSTAPSAPKTANAEPEAVEPTPENSDPPNAGEGKLEAERLAEESTPSPTETPTSPPKTATHSKPTPAATERTPTPKKEPAAPVRRAVVPPAILEAPAIELDETSAQKCSSTEVILTVSIDTEGQVAASRVLAAADKTCENAATQHVKSYQFKPGQDFENKPVPANLTLSIRFP